MNSGPEWIRHNQGSQPTKQQVINRWPPNCLQFEILLVKSKERLFSLDFSLFQKKKSSGVGPQFQVRLVDDNDLTQSGVIFTSKCRNWATNEVCRPQHFEKTEAIDAKNVIKPACHLTCKCYQHLKELCKCIVSIKMHENAKVYTGALKKTWPKLTQKNVHTTNSPGFCVRVVTEPRWFKKPFWRSSL